MEQLKVLTETVFRGNPKWTKDDMPDLDGKVAIVTGGAVGCGYETVKGLLEKNASVVIATRSAEKANKAIEILLKDTSINASKVKFIHLDLGDLSSIKGFVDEFNKFAPRLDYLILNAGVMMSPYDSKTKDGYELQFGTNVVGHFALVKALLPTLEDSAKKTNVRVVWLSSTSHWSAPKPAIQYDDLHILKAGKGLMGDQVRYGQSKAGDILLAFHMNRVYSKKNITTLAVHPGAIATELQRHMGENFVTRLMNSILLWPTPYGALNSLYAATSPKIKGGEYIIPWATATKARSDLYDEKAQTELWDYCEKQVALHQ